MRKMNNLNKYEMRKALDITFIKEVVYSFIVYVVGIVLCVNVATSSHHTSIYGIALFLLSLTVLYVMFIRTCYKHYINSVREFRNVYW